VLAVTLCGCDGGGASVAGITWMPSGPSTVVFIAGSVDFSPGFQLPSTVTAPTPLAFEIVVSASQSIDVQQVTIHMIDGSNLGGPMVTVPWATLMERFGTTHVAAGMTRTFTLWPSFVWTSPPRSVAADITCVDSHGVMHRLTVERPWP
jgi:hypothetical protein